MYAIMKTYKKPIISIDSGLAEGVYAASGFYDPSNPSVTFTELTKMVGVGPGDEYLGFIADFRNTDNLSQLTLTVKFSRPITNAWGDGASASFNGNEASFYWYQVPCTSIGLFMRAQGNLSTISITGYSCTNA